MHGVMGKPPRAVSDSGVANSKIMLMLLVAMTGVAPISLYLLVPALPVLATTFGRGISVAQMTVSLYMVGIACSQIVMGPLSDRFGRRPVLLAGLSLMVAASVACIFAESLPQLIAARFLQARHLLRHHGRLLDHGDRHRAGLAGNAARSYRGWRISGRRRQSPDQPRLHRLHAVPGVGVADHLRLRRRRAVSRGDADGPDQRRIWRVVCDHRIRLSDRKCVLRALRAAA